MDDCLAPVGRVCMVTGKLDACRAVRVCRLLNGEVLRLPVLPGV